MFLLQMRTPFCLVHKRLELRLHLDGFFPVMNMKCPSSSPLTNFSLQSISLGIRIATPDWKIFSHPLTLRLMSVFVVEVHFLYAAEEWILFLYPVC